jgi:hypothetical protein
MPDNSHVNQDQCETRRNHITSALATQVDRFINSQRRFEETVGEQITELVRSTTRVDERSKSNTHRLNWLWKIIGAVIIAIILIVIKIVMGFVQGGGP